MRIIGLIGLIGRIFFGAESQIANRKSQMFANEASGATADWIQEDVASPEYVAANDASGNAPRDNWVMLSPYGDFPNAKGMQRITKEDAETIANEFKQWLNLPNRVIGLPWFVGHPDHEAFKERDRDMRAYGRIKSLEARENGLFANVRWSEDGKALIKDQMFSGHSPHWRMDGPIKDSKHGTIFRPRKLLSVGFTNSPGLPVPTITAANEAANLNQTIDMDIKVLRTELGLPETATEAEVMAAIKDHRTRASTTAANERSASEAKKASDDALAAEKTKREKAETDFANERKARAGMLISTAIAAGKITKAEKAQWETDFANDFSAAETKLGAQKKKVHGAADAHSTNLGARAITDTRQRQQKQQTFVNEIMTQRKCDYNSAWKAAQSEKPELFVAEKEEQES